jgi:site-specific DNA recombinase
VHRYYACSSYARQGRTACKGRSIRMDKLDGLVTGHLVDRLLDRGRLAGMLASLASRRAAKAAAVDGRLVVLEKEAHAADERLRRFYKLVETGVAQMDAILKDRITALKADRDRVQAALDRARSGVRPSEDINPILVERFGQTMREKLTTGDVPFRKAYLGSIVDRVEVDDREIALSAGKTCWSRRSWRRAVPCPGFAVLFANGAPYGSRTRLFRLKSGSDANDFNADFGSSCNVPVMEDQ